MFSELSSSRFLLLPSIPSLPSSVWAGPALFCLLLSVGCPHSGFYSYSHSDHHNVAPHPESKVISEVVPCKSKGEVNTTLISLDWSREARRKKKLDITGNEGSQTLLLYS